MTREELKEILPHREPMLLVDEVWLNPDGSVDGKYLVKGDEYFLQGHFPGNPIVPGVIECEIAAQCGSILFERLLRKEHRIPLFVGINKVKFKKQIHPGDEMHMHVSLVYERDPYYSVEGKITVDDVLCMSGEFKVVLAKHEEQE